MQSTNGNKRCRDWKPTKIMLYITADFDNYLAWIRPFPTFWNVLKDSGHIIDVKNACRLAPQNWNYVTIFLLKWLLLQLLSLP